MFIVDFILANHKFTDDEFKEPARREPYYQQHVYTCLFGLIYAKSLKMLSEAHSIKNKMA